jgi:DNA-binding beta-propeller fold protein YncE
MAGFSDQSTVAQTANTDKLLQSPYQLLPLPEDVVVSPSDQAIYVTDLNGHDSCIL